MTARITSSSSFQYSAEECMQLARRFRAAGDLNSALAYAGKALEASAQDDRARFLMASLHAEAGLLPRAIREHQDLLERKPDWQSVRFHLGVLWLDARRITEAHEQFTVVAASKEPALAKFAEAMLAVIAKDFAKAREKIEAGLAVDVRPTEISAWIKSLATSLPTSAADNGASTPAPPANQGHTTLLRGYNQAPKV